MQVDIRGRTLSTTGLWIWDVCAFSGRRPEGGCSKSHDESHVGILPICQMGFRLLLRSVLCDINV